MHKELFCRSFIDSHLRYEPQQLQWPALDDRSLQFLQSIPVWGTALEVELNAGVLLARFAQTLRDPLIREAFELQGYEEDRHGRMLQTLLARYRLSAQPVVPVAQATRRNFLEFGYGECLDSFFGFAIYRFACEAKVVAPALTDLFARVLLEEARHIVFFVNWIAYDRAQRGLRSSVLRLLPSLYGYFGAVRRTMQRASSADREQRGMTLAGEIFGGITLADFLRTALEENERYMSAFDPRLLRPTIIPSIARTVLSLSTMRIVRRFMPTLPRTQG